jgi:hypothetical protein
VLAHYALMQGATEKPSKHGVELRLRCPFHEDKTPSLSINAAPQQGRYWLRNGMFGTLGK